MKRCTVCHKFYPLIQISNSGHCVDCEKKLRKCRNCGDRFVPEEKEIYCPVCYSNLIKVCRICKKEFLPTKNYQKYCPNCSKINKRNAKNNHLSPVNKPKTQENSFLDDKSIQEEDHTIELLIKALEINDTQESIIENIIKLGYSAVEPLIQTFAEGEKSLNYTIRDILFKIGKPALDPLIESLDESNIDVKINSIKTLGDIGDKKAIDPLIEALNDYDKSVRKNAVKALAQIDDERVIEPLIEALNDYDKSVRKNAVKALAQIDDERVIEPLIEALDDDSFYVRRAAAKALGISGDLRAVKPLCDSLKDEDVTVKISAAVSLGYIQSEDSLDDLIDSLEDENPEFVKIVEDIIIKLKSTEFLEEIRFTKSNKGFKVSKFNKEEFLTLIYNIFDDDPDVRVNAAKQFGKIKHEKSAEYLLKALGDIDENVVIAAVNSLGKLGFNNTIQPIISLLKGKLSVRTAAEEALVHFGSNVLNKISESLDIEDEDVRYALVMVLGDIEDEKANNLLIKLIRDPDQDIKLKAIDLLGHKKDNKSVHYIAELYDKENFETKKHIIKSLGLIGGPDVLKLFTGIDEPHQRLKNLIEEYEMKIKSKIEKKNVKKEHENGSEQNTVVKEVTDQILTTDKVTNKPKMEEIEIEKESSEQKSSMKNPLDLIDEIKKPLDDD